MGSSRFSSRTRAIASLVSWRLDRRAPNQGLRRVSAEKEPSSAARLSFTATWLRSTVLSSTERLSRTEVEGEGFSEVSAARACMAW